MPFVVLLVTFGLWLAPTAAGGTCAHPIEHCVKGSILLRLKKDVAPLRVAQVLRRQLGVEIVRMFGDLGLDLFEVRPMHGETPQDAIRRLNSRNEVRYAELNGRIIAAKIPNDDRFSKQWGLGDAKDGPSINAVPAWDTQTGQHDVAVAVLDTGIDNHEHPHPDLVGRVGPGCDAVNCDDDPEDDDETNSHGTRVAGIIGAAGNNNDTVPNSISGVAWDVTLLPCKCLDAGGGGTVGDAIACLNWVKQVMKTRRVAAVNMSWTMPPNDKSESLKDAIAELAPFPPDAAKPKEGTLAVVAAGNDVGDIVARSVVPATFGEPLHGVPNLIAVAAMRTDGGTLLNSNFSRFRVHLQAPGDAILSTVNPQTYGSLGMTSMAAPFVAGVAALLVSDDPERNWFAVRNLILTSTVADGSCTITRGHVDSYRALNCSNATVARRLLPDVDTVPGPCATPEPLLINKGESVPIAVLSLKCNKPGDPPNVIVEKTRESLVLKDDGLQKSGVGIDNLSGDGIYSLTWTPPDVGTFVLLFPNEDKVTVEVK